MALPKESGALVKLYVNANSKSQSAVLMAVMRKLNEKMSETLKIRGDWRANEFASVLDFKLNWYIRACCNMAEPAVFRIPAINRVRKAPDHILALFEVSGDPHLLRVAPAALDGDIEDDTVAESIVKPLQTNVPRKRNRRDVDDGSDSEAELMPQRLRPRRTPGAEGPREDQLNSGPSRAAGYEPLGGIKKPEARPQQAKQTEIIDLTMSDDDEDIKPKLEVLQGLDPEKEFSADVFDALGDAGLDSTRPRSRTPDGLGRGLSLNMEPLRASSVPAALATTVSPPTPPDTSRTTSAPATVPASPESASPASSLSSISTPPNGRTSSPDSDSRPESRADAPAEPGSPNEEDDESPETSYDGLCCETVEDLNFYTLLRVAVWHHLRALREKGPDADKAYREASFPVQDVDGKYWGLRSPVDYNRARRLLSDAVTALLELPGVQVKMYTTRVDYPGTLQLKWRMPEKFLESTLGVLRWRAAQFAAALDAKIDHYIHACAEMFEPCIFHIPADLTVRNAPESVLGVFEYSCELDALRVKPAVLDETDGDTVGELLKVQASRKRYYYEDAAADDARDARPVRVKEELPVYAALTAEERSRVCAVAAAYVIDDDNDPDFRPGRPPLPPATKRRRRRSAAPESIFDLDSSDFAAAAPPPPRRASRRPVEVPAPRTVASSSTRAAAPVPPRPRPRPQSASTSRASSAAPETVPSYQQYSPEPNQFTDSSSDAPPPVVVKVKVEGADAALEFSADVFDALGNHTTRLSTGDFEKRIQIAFRRGWSVERTAEWIRGV
ncbi:hypothetical protein H9P43_006557 [Blastocladiella emersonii ATCC 22665]|nr:hypothetical protein H9P43_006557 [Blastocladiella emersonii ATCC 22665]